MQYARAKKSKKKDCTRINSWIWLHIKDSWRSKARQQKVHVKCSNSNWLVQTHTHTHSECPVDAKSTQHVRFSHFNSHSDATESCMHTVYNDCLCCNFYCPNTKGWLFCLLLLLLISLGNQMQSIPEMQVETEKVVYICFYTVLVFYRLFLCQWATSWSIYTNTCNRRVFAHKKRYFRLYNYDYLCECTCIERCVQLFYAPSNHRQNEGSDKKEQESEPELLHE